MEWLLSKAVYGIASFYLMMRKVYLSKNKMGLKRAKRLVKMIRPKNSEIFLNGHYGSCSALKLFAIHMIRRKGGLSSGSLKWNEQRISNIEIDLFTRNVQSLWRQIAPSSRARNAVLLRMTIFRKMGCPNLGKSQDAYYVPFFCRFVCSRRWLIFVLSFFIDSEYLVY